MRTLRFLSMAGLATLLALPAAAQRAATTVVKPAGTNTNASQPAAAQQAATAYKPVVEKRAPTAQEIEVLVQGIKHLVDDSIEGLVPVTHPDGSVSIDLQGRFQNVSIAKVNADGSISMECVSSEKEARRFLTTPQPSVAPAPKPKPSPAPKAPEVM